LAQQQAAQQAVLKVRKDKEDACAREIQQVCAKHGCELIVGHQVKVSLVGANGNR
jgi:thiamine monophosphate synthase